MKYSFDSLHREIMKYRSLDYERYKSTSEVDLLQHLLNYENVTDYYEVEWDAFIDDLIGELPAPTKRQLARDWTLEFAPKTKLEAFIEGIIPRDECIRLLTFFRDHHREVFFCDSNAEYTVDDDQIEEIFSFFEDDCARLISKNLQESKRDEVHGSFCRVPRPNLKKIAMGDAPKPQFTAEEKKIMASIPSYPGDKQLVSREQIFLEAKEQVRLFVDKAERYDRDKQEADKPCMSHRSYVEPIEQNLHRRANRYLHFDKNPAYQVLFVMYILMRLPSRKHSWWEEKFAESIPTYLDTTQYFNGYKAKLDATIAKVVAVTQPTLDFGSAPLPQEPKTEKKKTGLSIPHAESLTINIHGSVDKIETTAQNVVIPQSSSLLPQESDPTSQSVATPEYPFVLVRDKAEDIIALLRKYMTDIDHSKPKDLMMPVRAAFDAGVIRKPTYGEFRQALPDLAPKNCSSFDKYLRSDSITPHPYDIIPAFAEMVTAFRALVA